MPICRTCRGEYAASESVCYNCGKPLGRKVDVCRNCGADTTDKRLCPRCKSDVGTWEREEMSLLEFVLFQGGILGLLPGTMAIFIWFFFWNPQESSLFYYPVLTGASFGISLLAFLVLYIKRLFWWERWWASQVYRATPIPIVLAVVVTALGGILLSAMWVFLYAAWRKPELMGQKMIFAIIYTASYVMLTIALTLLFIQSYIAHLNQHVPQPLFVDTKRLLMVVVNGVAEMENLKSFPHPVAPGPQRRASQAPIHEIIETRRIPENGGVLLVLREHKRVHRPDEHGEMREEWEDILWRVEADRWGRVQSIQPSVTQLPKQQDRVFREFGRYS